MAAYLYFYNPLQHLIALFYSKTKPHMGAAFYQVLGMWGLARTVRRTLGWAIRLRRGGIKFRTTAPTSKIPMRNVAGRPAGDARPSTPTTESYVPLNVGSFAMNRPKRTGTYPA